MAMVKVVPLPLPMLRVILTLWGFACLNYFVTKRKNSKVIHTLDVLDRKLLFCNKMFLLQKSYKVKVIKYG